MNTHEHVWQHEPEFFDEDDYSDDRLDSFYDWVESLTELPGREAFDAKLAPIADEVTLNDEGEVEYRIGDTIFGYKE
jgi:hypothetical protein